jgi:hypothetical protein
MGSRPGRPRPPRRAPGRRGGGTVGAEKAVPAIALEPRRGCTCRVEGGTTKGPARPSPAANRSAGYRLAAGPAHRTWGSRPHPDGGPRLKGPQRRREVPSRREAKEPRLDRGCNVAGPDFCESGPGPSGHPDDQRGPIRGGGAGRTGRGPGAVLRFGVPLAAGPSGMRPKARAAEGGCGMEDGHEEMGGRAEPLGVSGGTWRGQRGGRQERRRTGGGGDAPRGGPGRGAHGSGTAPFSRKAAYAASASVRDP